MWFVPIPRQQWNDSQMIERCSYCGCLLTYRAGATSESLATPEQRRALADEARATSNWPLIRERLAACGKREFWSHCYSCPGCGRRGGWFRPAYTQEEAEALASAQNRKAETDAAAEEVANRRDEVRRRASRDARYFATLLLARFPEWEPRLEFKDPSSKAGGEGSYLERDCALLIRFPGENSEVRQPLEVRVLCGEVLLGWGSFWHTHVFRPEEAGGEDFAHLHEAIDLLVNIVTEQVLFGLRCREGQPVSGGCFPLGADLPAWLRRSQSVGDDPPVLRSWRGTQDRVLLSEVEDVGGAGQE